MPATLEDLAATPGKAELLGDHLEITSPTGFLPGHAAGEIFASLRAYARRTRSGIAVGDNVGFVVDLPGRRSFSPDAAFFTGALSGMKFLEGAPAFAVEVRSEGDYGAAAEAAMVAKRADYFAAGTAVVWDVDLLSQDVVRAYRPDAPARPVLFRRGGLADAEPAVPGWSVPVDELFPDGYFPREA